MRYRQLSVTGDYTFGQGQANFYIDVPAAVAQSVKTRLLLWQGEWFLDTSVGTPWMTEVLGAHTQSLYDMAIRTVILQTPGVISIDNYSSTLDQLKRNLSISMTLNTQYGTTSLTVVL